MDISNTTRKLGVVFYDELGSRRAELSTKP
jgi:hypothetical protein